MNLEHWQETFSLKGRMGRKNRPRCSCWHQRKKREKRIISAVPFFLRVHACAEDKKCSPGSWCATEITLRPNRKSQCCCLAVKPINKLHRVCYFRGVGNFFCLQPAAERSQFPKPKGGREQYNDNIITQKWSQHMMSAIASVAAQWRAKEAAIKLFHISSGDSTCARFKCYLYKYDWCPSTLQLFSLRMWDVLCNQMYFMLLIIR
jgi:hypothetical protein